MPKLKQVTVELNRCKAWFDATCDDKVSIGAKPVPVSVGNGTIKYPGDRVNLGNRSSNSQALEWKESYSVGVEELDLQHCKLLDLINEIAGLRSKGATEKTCFAVLNAMIKYAEMHFETEERYFGTSGYPDSSRHLRAHEEFVEEVFSMVRDLDQEMLTLGAIAIYLQEWYKDHILGTDRKYMPFLVPKPAGADDAPEEIRVD